MKKILSVATVVSALFIGQGYAADNGNPAPMSLDVAGVRLGMTPDEAIAALKSFDPAMSIHMQYRVYEKTYFNDLGEEGDVEAWRSLAYRKYFNSIVGTNMIVNSGVPSVNRCISDLTYCRTIYKNDLQEIKIWFTPSVDPKQAKVIAVLRAKEFLVNPPAMQSLEKALLNKYSSTNTYEFGRPQDAFWGAGWIYGKDGSLLTKKAAISKQVLNYNDRGAGMPVTGMGLPDSAKKGDGIGLRAEFRSSDDNHDIAETMYVGLVDSTAMIESLDQSKTIVDLADKAKKERDRDAAAARGSTTKF